MKFGVFGCRHYHIEIAVAQLLAMGHTCIGVYEKEGSLAQMLARQYSLPLVTDETAFFACEPEIVLCASINNEKIDIIEKCCARGVHVMLDKPLVISMDDYRRLEHAFELGKPQIGMMLTERFNPSVCALKDLIDRRELGNLIGFAFSKPHKLNPGERESWHFNKKQNGGPVIDLMIHDIDLIRWLSGSEILNISGYMKVGNCADYLQLYDDAKLLILMDNGITAIMATDWWTPDAYPCFGNGRILCTGTRGKCEVYTTGEPLFRKGEFAILSTQTAAEEIVTNITPGKNMMEDFLERVAGRPSIITSQDILRTTWDSLVADQSCKVIRS